MTWPVAVTLLVALVVFPVCLTAYLILKPVPRGILAKISDLEIELAALKRTLDSVRTKIILKP